MDSRFLASSLPKEEMVQQILELQQTLEDLNTHVTKVDAENTALVEENNVLKVSASGSR
jgi:regulator of replication initiation timing